MKKMTKVALMCAVVGATMLTSCSKKESSGSSSATTFKTMKVAKSDITLTNKYTANIKGRQDIEVMPQVSGTLQQLCVTEGQQVKKGQTLFVIDQVPYKAALATAKASLEAAKAQMGTAQLTYNSTKTLFDQKVVSDFDLQTANNALLSAKAQVAQAEAQVVNAENNLSYTVVKAPSDGVVGTLPYRLGALVSPSMPQALTTVSDNSKMYVYFSVTESQLLEMTRAKGSVAEAIKAMPAVSLELVDGTTYEEKGYVETVSGIVDSKTGSVQLRAVFDNPKGLLHSGSTGNILMPIELKDQIVIPTTATVQAQTYYRVYVVDENGVANERVITVSNQKSGNQFIVTDGLEVGEEIVAEGAGMVTSGQTVKAGNSSAATDDAKAGDAKE